MDKKKSEEDVCEVYYVNTEGVQEVAAQMTSEDEVLFMAETFKLLSDPTRLRVVQALSHGELCVCDLATLLGVERTAVSNHLRLLRGMRLVNYRREGRLAYYSLADEHITSLLAGCLEHVRDL
ncbi:MAG: ArsR/SmtB family transcription factor [Thermodesulfobacteriota bacterium]